jgi:hypothetical protein
MTSAASALSSKSLINGGVNYRRGKRHAEKPRCIDTYEPPKPFRFGVLMNGVATDTEF